MLHFRLYLGRWRGAPNWLRDRSRKPAGRKPLVGSSPTPSATSPHFTRSTPIPDCLWDSDPQGEGCGEVLPTQSGAASARDDPDPGNTIFARAIRGQRALRRESSDAAPSPPPPASPGTAPSGPGRGALRPAPELS